MKADVLAVGFAARTVNRSAIGARAAAGSLKLMLHMRAIWETVFAEPTHRVREVIERPGRGREPLVAREKGLEVRASCSCGPAPLRARGATDDEGVAWIRAALGQPRVWAALIVVLP